MEIQKEISRTAHFFVLLEGLFEEKSTWMNSVVLLTLVWQRASLSEENLEEAKSSLYRYALQLEINSFSAKFEVSWVQLDQNQGRLLDTVFN